MAAIARASRNGRSGRIVCVPGLRPVGRSRSIRRPAELTRRVWRGGAFGQRVLSTQRSSIFFCSGSRGFVFRHDPGENDAGAIPARRPLPLNVMLAQNAASPVRYGWICFHLDDGLRHSACNHQAKIMLHVIDASRQDEGYGLSNRGSPQQIERLRDLAWRLLKREAAPTARGWPPTSGSVSRA